MTTIILGVFLVIVELARSIPAWTRLRHHGSAGVSESATALQAGAGIGWVWLGLAENAPWIALVSGIWFIFQVLLMVELWRDAESSNRLIARSFAISMLVSGAAIGTGLATGHLAEVLGIFIAVISVASRVPATITGMRDDSTDGLSLVSLTLNATEGFVYLIAGAGLGILATGGEFVLGFFVFGGVNFVSYAMLMARVFYRRRKGMDSDPPLDLEHLLHTHEDGEPAVW